MCLYLCVFNNFDACKYVCKYLYCFVHLQIIVNHKLELKLTSSLFVHNTSFSLELTNGQKNVVVLHFTIMERLATKKHSSLLGPFVSVVNVAPELLQLQIS